MATDNSLRVYACRAQLFNDAVLRPGVLDRERRRDWPAPVDLLHVGSFRLPFDEKISRCVIVRPRVADSSLPLYMPIFCFEN